MGSSVASSEDLAMSDVSGAREDKIFVSIRLRPLSEKETARHDLSDWECIDENTLIFRNSLPERSMYPSAYTFDRVFGCHSATRKVYEEGAKEVALSVVNGINSSIFAYGQTSSGKTYTMSGITAYAVADIYDYIEQQIDREFVMKFSAMEIYNEAVRDLLSSDIAPLRLLDDPERGTVVERLMEETLRDRNHLDELLYICEAQRKIGETSLNETSSRSHQILRLTIESSARDYFRTENSSTLAASVNFIDLAGSERASQTLSAGTRLKEGCHINRSLLTLGTVIRKLSKGRNGHVPYRDSKLTRILQNSLGGNARTAIICTISPARSHVEQSRNTLLFASCAKHVSTNAQVNVLVSDKALVKQLQKELARLESHVRSLESASASGGSSALLREKELQIERMEREIKEVTQQRDLALGRVEELLRLVGEDKASRVDEYSESGESSDVIDPLYADPSFKTSNKASRNCLDQPIAHSTTDQYFQVLPEMTDDNFLLDLSTPKFSGPDPCRGWELIHQRVDERSLDICKDVQCIEVAKEPRMERVVETDVVALPRPDRNEAKHVKEAPVNEDELSSSSPRKEDKEENLGNGEDATSPSSSPRKEDNNHVGAESFYGNQDINMHEKDRDDVEATATAIPLSSSLKEGVEVSNVSSECACEALQQKVENMQKAIKRVLTQNIFEPSPCSKGDVSSCGSNKLARSRSCTLMAQSSSPLLGEADKDAIAPPSSKEMEILLKKPRQRSKARSRARREKFCRQDSVLSDCLPSEHAKMSEEDIKDVDDIYRKFKEMGRSQSQSHSHSHSQSETQFDDNVEGTDYEDAHDEDVEEEEDEFLEEEKHSEPKDDWAKEFQKQRSKIIELWDRCYVPLVHRTYFFTLFNGDPSDSIYLEVELRRLSFLSTSLNRPNQTRSSLTPTRASSIKALTREREMLSKQMHRKLDRNEREALYKKWGINLNTKQRSLQLTSRVWTDPKEVEDSAALVAKLVQLMEPGRQVPKEMFGLSFSAVPALDRRSMSWKG